MGRVIDETGNVYGRWTVKSLIKKDGRRYWLCECDCGVEKVVDGRSLRKGQSKSCGCLKAKDVGDRFRTHGLTGTALFRVWINMKQRCYDSHHRAFHNYGGRGITVCDEWLDDPIAFVRWAENNGWSDGLTIDRIDNDGSYSPDNCRFVTYTVQARNKRTSVFVEYGGQEMCFADFVDKYCTVNQNAARGRLRLGWSLEKIAKTPVATVMIFIIVASMTIPAGAQYYASSGQAYREAVGGVSIDRNPGPVHSTHCTMCLGNHLISSHGHSYSQLNRIGYQQWSNLHANCHNPAPVRIYAPTPQCVFLTALEYAELEPGEVFVDLGSGDGRVVVRAAWLYGCRAVGIELDADKIKASEQLAKDYGVGHLCKFIKADVTNVTLKKVDVVYVYLESTTLKKLEHRFADMKPGAKLISYQHKIRCQYLDKEHDLFIREVE